MKLPELSPAGVLALIVAFGTLLPTNALPKEPRKIQSSVGSSIMVVSKTNHTIPTSTQEISAKTSSPHPQFAFWLRAVPKRMHHRPKYHNWPGTKHSKPCAGGDCNFYNGTSTEAIYAEDSGSYEDAEDTPQISTGLESALHCDDPQCHIICKPGLCIPYLGSIDGEGSSGPASQQGLDERDDRVGTDVGDIPRTPDGQDGTPYALARVPLFHHNDHTSFKSPFLIRDGKLFQNGGQISTRGDVPYQLFKPSVHPGSIQSGFATPVDILAWENPALTNGQASFCRMHKDVVYIVFDAKPDPTCEEVELVVLAQPKQGKKPKEEKKPKQGKKGGP